MRRANDSNTCGAITASITTSTAPREWLQRKADELLEAGAEDKEVCRYKLWANDAATALAPYVHPKIAQEAPRSEDARPYVIRVPEPTKSTEDWARLITNQSRNSGRDHPESEEG